MFPQYQHVDTETKQLKSSRRHFEIIFRLLKWMHRFQIHFYRMPNWQNDIVALHVAWHRTGGKPLFEPLMDASKYNCRTISACKQIKASMPSWGFTAPDLAAIQLYVRPDSMMTSSNGNIFCVTGEFHAQRQWNGALICAWIKGWVNNNEAGDLRRHRAHYDVTVMPSTATWRYWIYTVTVNIY